MMRSCKHNDGMDALVWIAGMALLIIGLCAHVL
jgi:hypothetical protein